MARTESKPEEKWVEHSTECCADVQRPPTFGCLPSGDANKMVTPAATTNKKVAA